MPGTMPLPAHVVRELNAEMAKQPPIRRPYVRPSDLKTLPFQRRTLAGLGPEPGAAPTPPPKRKPKKWGAFRTVGRREARQILLDMGFPASALGTEHAPKIPIDAINALRDNGMKVEKKAKKPKAKKAKVAKKVAKKPKAKKAKAAKKPKAKKAKAAKKVAKKLKAKKPKAKKAKPKKVAKKAKPKKVAKKAKPKKVAKKAKPKKVAKKAKAAKPAKAEKKAEKRAAKKVKAEQKTIPLSEAREQLRAAGADVPKSGITKKQRAAFKKQGITVARAKK